MLRTLSMNAVAIVAAGLIFSGCASQPQRDVEYSDHAVQNPTGYPAGAHPYPDQQSLYKNPNPQIEALHVQAYNLDIGYGVSRDQAKANELYLRTSLAGDVRSMFNLAINLYHGDGIVKDEVESFAWIDLARFMTQQSNDMKLKWSIREFHDEVTKNLTAEQLEKGKQRTRYLNDMITPGQLQ